MSFYSNVFYNALNSSAVLVIASGYSIYCKLETGRVQSGCSLVQLACATHTPHPRRIALALQFTFSSCSPDCELGQTSAVCSSFRCGQGALRLQVNAPRVKSRVVRSSPRFCRRRYAMAAPRPRLPRRGACATAPWSPSASPPPPRTPCRTTVRSKPASALAQTLYCLFLHSAF